MSLRLRRRLKRKRAGKVRTSKRLSSSKNVQLADMKLDEFIERGLSCESESESEGEDDQLEIAAGTKHKMKKHQSTCLPSQSEASEGDLSQRLAKIDPEFYEFLHQNDSQLLEMCNDDAGSSGDHESQQFDLSTDEEDLGTIEPRPLNITSRKHKETEDGSESSGGSEMEEGFADAAGGGVMVTKAMIQDWVQGATGKSPSLASLSCLTSALHDAIKGLVKDRDSDQSHTYFVDDATVFNCLVISCLKSVKDAITVHLSTNQAASSTKQPRPSTLKGWSKVKSIVRMYLLDLLCLLETLRNPSMQCALLKHIQSFVSFYLCFPKIVKRLRKVLVVCWSEGESHVQVMAFVVLRRITISQPHPDLHKLLKKLYLAFVSNSKFTSAKTLPQIRFMQNCLVELLCIDPPTSYQHGFVYIRQLAVHLRTALTSGKKHAVKAVYNWQFIHCLDLWSHMLCHVTHDSLRPLVYPLVQVMLGAIHLQPSARHYPLRLHIVRTLVELSSATGTFIPLSPYLLEIFESHGVGVASHVTSGKPPNLAILLHATKQQLESTTFQSALLNETYELMLKYFAAHSSTIGFPELAYPSLLRLRKVCKSVQVSWLRLQLRQLIEKVEAVGSEVTKLRAAVEFSPKDNDKVLSWERERREKGNAVTSLLATWLKVHTQAAHKSSPVPDSSNQSVSIPTSPSHSGEGDGDGYSSCEQEETDESAESDAGDDVMDIVEDFELSSDDSD